MSDYKPIAESNNFIILDKYTNIDKQGAGYQSEADLEKELIKDLDSQGIKHLKDIKTPEAMLKNARLQLEDLNDVKFSDDEWKRFC